MLETGTMDHTRTIIKLPGVPTQASTQVKTWAKWCRPVVMALIAGLLAIAFIQFCTWIHASHSKWMRMIHAAKLRMIKSTTLSPFASKKAPVVKVTSGGKASGIRVFDRPDKQSAADILTWVDSTVKAIRAHIDSKYTETYLSQLHPKKAAIARQIKKRLHSNYKTSSIVEHMPAEPGVDVSYNMDKGDKLAMCVRQWGSPEKIHEPGDVLFVALHEVAHSLNCDESSYQCGNSYGHDDMFWYIFKQLLDEATHLGVYTPVNYAKAPIKYCSLDITYSPQFDHAMMDDQFIQ